MRYTHLSKTNRKKMKHKQRNDTSIAKVFWNREQHTSNISYFKQKPNRIAQIILPFDSSRVWKSNFSTKTTYRIAILTHVSKAPPNIKATSGVFTSKWIHISRCCIISTCMIMASSELFFVRLWRMFENSSFARKSSSMRLIGQYKDFSFLYYLIQASVKALWVVLDWLYDITFAHRKCEGF